MLSQNGTPTKTLKELAEQYPALEKEFTLADKGDLRALANIAEHFADGKPPLPKDEKFAFQLMTQSAEKGFATAQSYLAWYYTTGIGTEVNHQKAVEWLQKAAAQSDVEAIFRLGVCYEGGVGVAKDAKKALELFKAAADKDFYEACYKLGWYYENGIETEKDLHKAYLQYDIAGSTGGHIKACERAGWFCENGIAYEGDALRFYEKAANKGSRIGKINKVYQYINRARMREIEGLIKELAEINKIQESKSDDPITNLARSLCFEHGLGVERDLTKSNQYLTLAAEKNDPRACYLLGLLYLNGRNGITENCQTALSYFEKAAAGNFKLAYKKIASLYQGTTGIPKDDNKFFEFLVKAAEAGDDDPLLAPHLVWYYSGVIKPANWEKAKVYAHRGERNKDPYCLWVLGHIYENGCGFRASLDVAMDYYDKAIAAGSVEAKAAKKKLEEKMGANTKKDTSTKKDTTTPEKPVIKTQEDLIAEAVRILKSREEKAEPQDPEELVKQAWNYENGIDYTGAENGQMNAKKARAFYEKAKRLNHPLATARLSLFAQMSTLPATMAISYRDCEFVKTLGSGTFSTVYQVKLISATFDDKPEVVAVKRPKKCDAFLLNSFKAEICFAQSNIDSPNVIKYVGVCLSPPMIAMEKCGSTLTDFIRDHTFEEVTHYKIARSIANGIADFHKAGFIHRDLKPDNILFDEKMTTPKISDFGFAIKVGETPTHNSGTKDFKAPELFTDYWDAEMYTNKIDCYAFAMVLYFMFTKKFPFGWINEGQIKEAVRGGARPEIPSHCPKMFSSLIQDCWHQDPRNRPTAVQIRDRLDMMISAVQAKR